MSNKKQVADSSWYDGTPLWVLADDRDNRIGDIILLAHPPAYFNINHGKNSTIGKHGFDPALPDMHAPFYACGPAFKEHTTTKGFENVNIYIR